MKDYTNAIEGTLEEVLNQLQDKYIKVDCTFGSERNEVMNGKQWIEYFQAFNKEALELNAIATPTEAPFNYYNFDIETYEG